MRNIFLFFKRFSTFFTFLILQIICLVIIFRFNKFHNAIGLNWANNINGVLHEKQNRVNGFLGLRSTADSIAKRNAELLNAKPFNYLQIDTGKKEVADFIPIDTLGNIKKIVHFVYRPSSVIFNNSNGDKKKYLWLARGKNYGVGENMAVIGAETNAVVGKVIYADAKYSYVMTLLNVQSVVPAKIFRSGENGTVTWDGVSNKSIILNKIPNTSNVKRGDSVMTSKSSDIFPENLMIGIVDTFSIDKKNNNYIIKVIPSANFNKINYVQVIENVQQNELRNAQINANKALGEK